MSAERTESASVSEIALPPGYGPVTWQEAELEVRGCR